MGEKRGNVWLAAAGLVINSAGEWLVVKKKYGGLKDKWSLPAGFVQPGETLDEAAVREIKEETGIDAEIVGLIGMRTGVIRDEVSDNMAIFLLRALSEKIIVQTEELWTATFSKKEVLKEDKNTSALLLHLLQLEPFSYLSLHDGMNPGEPFGYTKYHLYFKNSKK
ncbi:NUDIX domain-containing protein [Thermaerobacillus caldiproteolyticus]|uniref:NUDIX domain-containing protein n=1 Tax=Thermaerobacillus caldiproteolyticus TaxID=247480 RepID=UPI00188A4D7A|nr:NUDIX domain-containing protein [Anoxybacillus caldiproteolyticus]QPA30532.1 NUDIX domain-containing protein [Anoxybacillus caldiproteolyticus]